MKNYLLIYRIDDYHEMDGGIHFITFDTMDEMEESINGLSGDTRCKFLHAFRLLQEYKIVPVEKVTKWEIQK